MSSLEITLEIVQDGASVFFCSLAGRFPLHKKKEGDLISPPLPAAFLDTGVLLSAVRKRSPMNGCQA